MESFFITKVSVDEIEQERVCKSRFTDEADYIDTSVLFTGYPKEVDEFLAENNITLSDSPVKNA
jgi:hypothetical protein